MMGCKKLAFEVREKIFLINEETGEQVYKEVMYLYHFELME